MTRKVSSTPLARVAAAVLLLACAAAGARAADPVAPSPVLDSLLSPSDGAPESTGGSAADPAHAFSWRFGGEDAGDSGLRARARTYAAGRESVPEPGALATAAVALAATGMGLAAGRRRTRRPVGGAEWDGGDDSVLAS